MSNIGIYTVVLTGGISSGKTAVSGLFRALGVPVIDTDTIAHEIVQPGRPALDEIVKTFGPEFLDSRGALDRAKMREAVFENPNLRYKLEAILHPPIAREALQRVRNAHGPYCILVVPLYAESARWPWIDRVLVVDVEETVQVERLMQRDGISLEQAESILAAQARRQDRLELADDVISNTGTLEDLPAKVRNLHQEYCRLAADAAQASNLKPDP